MQFTELFHIDPMSAFSPSDLKEWSPFITHIRINVLLQAWNKGERNVNVNHHLRAFLQDYFSLIWTIALSGKNRPASLSCYLKKNVFDQLHTGVQKKRSQLLTQWTTTKTKQKKEQKKSNHQVDGYWKNTMYINKGRMDETDASGVQTRVITSATTLLGSFN